MTIGSGGLDSTRGLVRHLCAIAMGRWAALAAGLLGVVLFSASASAICLDVPGDVSGDGLASVVDVQCNVLMNLWSLAGQVDPVPECLDVIVSPAVTADHNCDHVINVADTLLSVRFTLQIPLGTVLDANEDECHDSCQTDFDGDGDFDFTDCAPMNPDVGSESTEICNGFDDDCDTQIDDPGLASVPLSCSNGDACDGVESCEPVADAAGIVINEIMAEPVMGEPGGGAITTVAGGGDLREWVELYNGSGTAVNLRGWSLENELGHSHIIDPGGALFIPAKGYLVLGGSNEMALNGGLFVTYVWSEFALGDDMGSVVLKDSLGTIVDRVDYEADTYPVNPGASLARVHPAASAESAASWATATWSYGAGGLGTPWGPNADVAGDACMASEAPLDCGEAVGECESIECDPILGCVETVGEGECDDGDACTVGDTCSDGDCVSGEALQCDDGEGCTVDACDPLVGCTTTPGSGPCNDGDDCTFNDQCAGGSCVGGTAVFCNDGNPCTSDSCIPGLGCQNIPNSSPCSDFNACTVGDQCVGGFCQSGPFLSCEDGNPCTDDFCSPASGCTSFFNTSPCDDSNPCTLASQCLNGGCIGSVIDECSDGNLCTTDVCDPLSGCVNIDNSDPCEDGDACTGPDFCSGGECVGGSGGSCDDSNPCTTDSCPGVGGCVHTFNSLPCDDSNACTTGDFCSGGNCVSGPPQDCDDGDPCTQDSCSPATGGCINTPAGGSASGGTAAAPPAPLSNSNCCASHSGTGCDDALCQFCVCDGDPFCCNTLWDSTCAAQAGGDGTMGVCMGSCPCVGGSAWAPCCEAHSGTGCDDFGCESCVCGGDAFCCNTQWDAVCANRAETLCDPSCECDGGPNTGGGTGGGTGNGGAEICNGVDDDCDGATDEEGAQGCTTYYADEDDDGWGAANDFKCLCNPTLDYNETTAGDCYDFNELANPSQTQYFDEDRGDGSFDYNCDGDSTGDGAFADTFYNCFGSCSGNPGWHPTSGIPACGEDGLYIFACLSDLFGGCFPSSNGIITKFCQ